jgi:uncharacterized protein YneR
MKQLYFLHIPKTAGKFLSASIEKSIPENKKTLYISTHFPNNKEFLKDKIYISAHAGMYIPETIENIDVATIVRNPINARASYFNFIYHMYLDKRKEYLDLNTMREKFLYYLFEDNNFLSHNNYQSRFLCNSSNPKSWDRKEYFKSSNELLKKYYDGQGFDWFVGDEKTSLDLAISNISKFKIKNTVDRMDLFLKNISEWFLDNHNLAIKFNKDDKINESVSTFKGDSYSSKDLIEMLSKDDIEKILKLNSIDYAVYNFVKAMES